MLGSQSRKHTDRNLQLNCKAFVSQFLSIFHEETSAPGASYKWGGVRKINGGERRESGQESNDRFLYFDPPVPLSYSFSHSLAVSFPSLTFRNDRLQRRLPIVKINVLSHGRLRCHMWNVGLANQLNQM